MSTMRETCSVCRKAFEVQFRYQMEEKDGGFAFFCSQACQSAHEGPHSEGSGAPLVNCDACATRFSVELVSQVLYVKGQRRHACSMPCRAQLAAEAKGLRLGDLAAQCAAEQAAPVAGTESSLVPSAETLPPPAVRPGTFDPAAVFAPEAEPAPRVVASPAPTQAQAVPFRATVQRTETQKKAGPANGPRIIAVFNHKGGTGKTTTSVSLAAGIALRGKRVLLVDTDSQGNVAVSLGVKSERTLYHVLVMGLPAKDAVTTVRQNLDLLPSNETLAAAELYLAGRQNRDRVLATRLEPLMSQYDYVVVDCSPSLSLLNQNALCLVDSVLVPVACDYLSLVGMRQVIKTVKNVNQHLHHPVQIWGILPTFFDARAKICHEAVDTLRQHFAERCLSPIRQAIKVKEAPAQGQTIFEYAAGSPAAEDYANVVTRVLGAAFTEEQPVPSSVSSMSAFA
jgi:chromosome partitioning protein